MHEEAGEATAALWDRLQLKLTSFLMLWTVKTAAAVATLTTDSVQTDVFSARCVALESLG